jgi:hypothetical protein
MANLLAKYEKRLARLLRSGNDEFMQEVMSREIWQEMEAKHLRDQARIARLSQWPAKMRQDIRTSKLKRTWPEA